MRHLAMTLALLLLPSTAFGQSATPPHYPYAFSNFVWWSDADLRAGLHKRIPNLPDELVPDSPLEKRLREALTTLLRAKGILANVFTQNPGPPSHFNTDNLPFYRPPASFTPHPQIVFSVLAPPEIVVSKLVIDGPAESLGEMFQGEAHRVEGRPLDESSFAWQENQLSEPLRNNGYLSATVTLSHGSPEKSGGHTSATRIEVPLVLKVDTGPQYHVGALTVQGGPLLRGRDLVQASPLHHGDVASPQGLLRFEAALTGTYTRAGYLRAHVEDQPVLDPAHATADYHLEVVPGPQYRLGTLTVLHLAPAQESKVRDLLGLKPGDIYNQAAVDALYSGVRREPLLQGQQFSFSPHIQPDNTVDLTLDFFKGDGSIPTGTVTVH